MGCCEAIDPAPNRSLPRRPEPTPTLRPPSAQSPRPTARPNRTWPSTMAARPCPVGPEPHAAGHRRTHCGLLARRPDCLWGPTSWRLGATGGLSMCQECMTLDLMSRLLHRSLTEVPISAVRGRGIHVFTGDGRTVIDGAGGAAVACLGHGDERVLSAMAKQAEAISYAHTGLFTTPCAEALADHLTGPGTPAGEAGLSHAFFVSSGSEAAEAALKLARQYFVETGQSQRDRYIARRQSYHGNTLGALAASGNWARRTLYEPILGTPFDHVSPCFAYHFQTPGESDAAYVERLVAELDAAFAAAGEGRVAAFLAETVVGATSGCVAAVPGYFGAVREVCDRHGALLILDEVMCGLGRTGTLHAWEQEGVVPDIHLVAKGLAGGYQPIGGLLVAAHLVEALRRGSGAFLHGHTYQAHPIGCAAALAVQRVIVGDGLVARVSILGDRLGSGLRAALAQHAHVGDIRGRGLFWAVEFVANRQRKQPFAPACRVHAAIGHAAFARDLAVYPMGGTVDGRSGDHVLIAPPFICSEGEIDEIVGRFAEAVRAVLATDSPT